MQNSGHQGSDSSSSYSRFLAFRCAYAVLARARMVITAAIVMLSCFGLAIVGCGSVRASAGICVAKRVGSFQPRLTRRSRLSGR